MLMCNIATARECPELNVTNCYFFKSWLERNHPGPITRMIDSFADFRYFIVLQKRPLIIPIRGPLSLNPSDPEADK